MGRAKTKLLVIGGAAAIAAAAGALAWRGPAAARPGPAAISGPETVAPADLPGPATPEIRWAGMAEGSWLRVRITRKTGLGEVASEVKYVLESRGPRMKVRYGLFDDRGKSAFTIAAERDGSVTRQTLESWEGPSDFAIWRAQPAGQETLSSAERSVLCNVSDGDFVQAGCVVQSICRVRDWRPVDGQPEAEPVRRLLTSGRADTLGIGRELMDQRRFPAAGSVRVGGRAVLCDRVTTRIAARRITERERKAGIGPQAAATIRSREEPEALLSEICGANIWGVDREREEWVPTEGWRIPVLVVERWTDQGRRREVRTEILDWDLKPGGPLAEVPGSGVEPDDLPR